MTTKKTKTIEVQLLGRPLKETDSIRFYFWCIRVKKMEYDECNTFNLYVILTKTLFSFLHSSALLFVVT